MTTKKIKLFCILDGDSSSFSVKVDVEDTVDDLKKAIKEENLPELEGVHSSKLLLHQVAVPEEGIKVNLNMIEYPTPLIKATAEVSEDFGTSPARYCTETCSGQRGLGGNN
ncbi:hypothetical protein BGZ76_005215 [Entomortierella beljakovae]|nr:hypothetical protein BGZ76_005215 [Entomortierella beljakovae]